jgi:hypothetical protein
MQMLPETSGVFVVKNRRRIVGCNWGRIEVEELFEKIKQVQVTEMGVLINVITAKCEQKNQKMPILDDGFY